MSGCHWSIQRAICRTYEVAPGEGFHVNVGRYPRSADPFAGLTSVGGEGFSSNADASDGAEIPPAARPLAPAWKYPTMSRTEIHAKTFLDITNTFHNVGAQMRVGPRVQHKKETEYLFRTLKLHNSELGFACPKTWLSSSSSMCVLLPILRGERSYHSRDTPGNSSSARVLL